MITLTLSMSDLAAKIHYLLKLRKMQVGAVGGQSP